MAKTQLFVQLLLLIIGASLAQGQGIIAGATCSSRSPTPAAYQACINSWVNTQQALQAPGVAGGTCTSRPPQALQSCVNTYIEANLQPPFVTDACGAAADKQACLNGLVDRAMTEAAYRAAGQPLPPQQQSAPVPVPVSVSVPVGTPRRLLILVGGSCISRGPLVYQQCINSFVLQHQQAAAQRDGTAAAAGPLCASQDQQCINGYILRVLEPAAGSGTSSCAGMAATQQQACLNAVADSVMTGVTYRAAGQPLPPQQQQQRPAPVPVPVLVPVPVGAPRRLLSLAA